MLKQAFIYIYKENGIRGILSFFIWYFDLYIWRIIAEHLRDIHGEVKPDECKAAIKEEIRRIKVRRTFGGGDFLSLYAEYVRQKLDEQSKKES